MTATTSKVPAIVDKAFAVLAAAAPAGTTVIDGPYLGDPPPGDFLCVGWSPYVDGKFAQDRIAFADTAGGRNDRFDIVCYASCWPGADFKTVRDRVLTLMDLAAASLNTDPTMTSTVSGWVLIDQVEWDQVVTTNGLAAGAEFHLSGTARI